MKIRSLIYFKYSIIWMCHYNLFINFPTIKTDVGCFYFYWSLHFIFQLNLVLSYFCVWAPWFQGLAEGTVCSFAELPSVHLLQRKAQLIWWNCSRHGLPIWLVIVIMFSICSSHIRAGETTARWKTSESEEDMKNAAFHCTVWTFFFSVLSFLAWTLLWRSSLISLGGSFC